MNRASRAKPQLPQQRTQLPVGGDDARRALLRRLLPQVIPAQEVHDVGEGGRRNVVKQRGERLLFLARKAPCDLPHAEAVRKPCIGRAGRKARKVRILAAAVHAHAAQALHLARVFGCKKAVLKERSPSCGAGEIYDGTFSGALVPGDGVTAELLKAHGITIIGESKI